MPGLEENSDSKSDAVSLVRLRCQAGPPHWPGQEPHHDENNQGAKFQ